MLFASSDADEPFPARCFMFKLIRNARVFAPHPLGIRDVLTAAGKIAAIAERLTAPEGLPVETIDARGKYLVPGFVDLHVHLLGGGGEGGFRTRTPEIQLSSIVRAGVTTVVGCLGTDDVTRRPESLLAKAMQLDEEGVSTYIYTGSYQFPPPTITGSVRKDIALIPKVIGVGEVALSDHRSSQPTYEELCRLAAEARVGGMIGGKAGLVHLHMGDGPRGLETVLRMVEETEIPIDQFLPTHVSRSERLLGQAIEFARRGGNIDFTAAPKSLGFASDVESALRRALDAGVPLERITLSSDSNGSLPLFDEHGRLLRLAVADIGSLHQEIRDLVGSGFRLEHILPLVTAHPARRLGIDRIKGRIEVGLDADLVLLDEELNVDWVMARGRVMVADGRVRVKGTFEI